jgi:hypothetical protein
MQLKTVFSFKPMTSMIHPGSGVSNPFKSFFTDKASKGCRPQGTRFEHDGALRLDKEVLLRLQDRFGRN